MIEAGHTCTGGSRTSISTCYEICGDGLNYPTTSYDCDDYDTTSGDGCSSSCEVEDGWYCLGGSTTTYDVCYEICGDEYDHQ